MAFWVSVGKVQIFLKHANVIHGSAALRKYFIELGWYICTTSCKCTSKNMFIAKTAYIVQQMLKKNPAMPFPHP